MLTLYGAKGAGSTAIEAALKLAGAAYNFVEAAPWGDEAERGRLARVSPVGQVPALVLESGEALTESAAILLWICETWPDAKLAPPPGDEKRPAFLRWLIFLAANFYATYAISDKPSRFIAGEAEGEALTQGAYERRRELWRVMEAGLDPDPFLLGPDMFILDVYAAMMTHWSPGREWFEANCPKLLGAVQRTEAHPVVAEVFARNFDA
ncbi:MAG: glutathione S-transferase family protein [Maricaulaceae bacterium]|jgi:GST-like protein